MIEAVLEVIVWWPVVWWVGRHWTCTATGCSHDRPVCPALGD